jgi:site-specific recombinase XerD
LKTKYCNINIISRDEFEKMLYHTTNLKHKTMLMFFYGSGIRLNECVSLKLNDINRQEMVLRVRGKGNKQHFTILSQRCLPVLESYYRSSKKKPKTYVFEGRSSGKMSPNMFEHAVRTAAARAGIKKKSHLTFFATLSPRTF